VKEDVREIEVEVLPPGAIPNPRGAEPDRGPRVFTKEADQPKADTKPQFDDPFVALVAKLMDNAFTIPGTNVRFGLDPIIGLLTGYGDAATSVTSLLMLMRSAKHGVPKIVLTQMALNIVLNSTVGAIPLAGDAFSFWFKSNERNYALLQKHANTTAPTGSSWLFVLLLFGGVGGMLFLVIVTYAAMLATMLKFIFGK